MENIQQAMDEKGYVVLKNAIPFEDVTFYKETIKEYFSDANRHLHGMHGQTAKTDAFNQKELFCLHKIFSTETLIEPLRKLTDNQLMYLHHSDIHYNFQAYGWHDDTQTRHLSRYPINYTYLEEQLVDKPAYRCYTVVIYTQPHHDGSGLTIIEGSHKNGAGGEISQRKKEPSQIELNLSTDSGDVVVFDARLFHRGNSHKPQDRGAIFFRMGLADIHGIYHAKGAIERQERENGCKYFVTRRLADVLEENNIKL